MNLHRIVFLCLGEIGRDNPVISPRSIANALSPTFPDVPLAVLRVIASMVLKLYFDPVGADDIDDAGLSVDDKIAALEFFANAQMGEVVALRDHPALRAVKEGPA